MLIRWKNHYNQKKGAINAVLMTGVILILGIGIILGSLIVRNDFQRNSEDDVGTIARVVLMPNLPEPFRMRDWRQVTRDYDSLFFDLNATGTFLPFISTNFLRLAKVPVIIL